MGNIYIKSTFLSIMLLIFIYLITISQVDANEADDTNIVMVNLNNESRQMAYQYDNNGRLLFQTFSDKSYALFTYDSNGNLSGKTKKKSGDLSVVSLSSASYDIYVYGVANTVKKVEFPTWTANGGQDDLEIIAGEKVGTGIWKGRVVYTKHMSQYGDYITDIKIDGQVKEQVTVKVKWGITYRVPQEVSLKVGQYDVYIDGIASTVKEVRFPTWTANGGQDDLVIPYIKGEKVSEGTWKITIPFNKHNNETGEYITHYYA